MTDKDTHFRGGDGDPPNTVAPEIVGLTLSAEHRDWTLRWRETWQRGLRLPSELAFALLCSLVWLALYNASFWHQAAAAMWHPALPAVLFLVSLFVVILSLQAILLLLVPEPRWMKGAASLLFLIAAASSYFIATYSAVMNEDMMRNVLQTDRAEVHGLVNGDLLLHILAFGVVPATLVWCVRFPNLPWRRRAKRQLLAIAAALGLSLCAIFACSANYAVFFREHKPVRFALSPLAPVASLVQLASEHRRRAGDGPLMNPEGKAQRIGAAHSRPLVVFLVIGETARAANFQLGGYGRSTTPQLASTPGLVYFEHTTACGTSTAISVPCLFSPLGREDFVVEDADASTNLLDSLSDAGFDVEWRDNNAGCKGVCPRVRTLTYEPPAGATDCPGGHCYDEVMLADLSERLRTVSRDTVIVFHQNGSHGPGYSERYPPALEKFSPSCHSNELHRCTTEEVVNAYDNTIAYTDSVLSRQIELLRVRSAEFDSALLYVSDHGESLGEQGVYLHGLPYRFAPKTQTEVPMLLWTSEGYRDRAGLDLACLREEARGAHSHDELYHTVLGLAETRNRAYSAELDVASGCRSRRPRGE